jgi:hypothetical protein
MISIYSRSIYSDTDDAASQRGLPFLPRLETLSLGRDATNRKRLLDSQSIKTNVPSLKSIRINGGTKETMLPFLEALAKPAPLQDYSFQTNLENLTLFSCELEDTHLAHILAKVLPHSPNLERISLDDNKIKGL